MVKLKIVWPCSSNNRSRSMPPPLRRSSSISTQANSNLARYFSIAFFIFAATTYLVFSLDMLMVPEEESITMMPRRQLEHEGVWLIPETAFPAAKLDKSLNAGKLRTIPDTVAANEDVPVASDLVILAEEDMEALALEKQEAEEDMRIQQKASSTLFGKLRESNNRAPFNPAPIDEEDDDFANGLNQIGLAMQQQQQPAQVDAPVPLSLSSASRSSSINLIDSDSGMGSDEMEDPPQPEEEEDEEEISVNLATSIPASPAKVSDASDAGPVVIPTSEWRRIHTCKYGRSEKSPTLAYGTWVWRHKKGAVLHDDYTKTPSDSKIRHLKAALKAIFTQEKTPDIRSVAGLASEAGYTLCKIDLEESIVVAWQPRLRGDALFFTRHAVSLATMPTSVSNVVIEVPHALFDHTLHQGLHVFSETKAVALILSESHRCSRSLPNKCTGNEGEPIRNLCSSSSKSYHNSDAAHAVQTTFHAVHEVLSEEHPESLVVSLHATKADEFVVSDGTSNPVPGSSPVFAFANQLAKNLAEHTIGLCNEHVQMHAPVSNLVSVSEDKRHVCGATNVQGRHLNGASDPCRAKVHRNGQELKASGRFLHVEQPVSVVVPIDSKSTKPVVSKPLSEAILVALNAMRQHFAALGSNQQ